MRPTQASFNKHKAASSTVLSVKNPGHTEGAGWAITLLQVPVLQLQLTWWVTINLILETHINQSLPRKKDSLSPLVNMQTWLVAWFIALFSEVRFCRRKLPIEYQGHFQTPVWDSLPDVVYSGLLQACFSSDACLQASSSFHYISKILKGPPWSTRPLDRQNLQPDIFSFFSSPHHLLSLLDSSSFTFRSQPRLLDLGTKTS